MKLFLAHVLALLFLLLSTNCFAEEGSVSPDKLKAKDSVFERVMRTGELRCGYWVYPPMLMRDPNTGEFSGIMYELVTEAARQLNLDVVWAEEVGAVQAIEGLRNDRFDAMCTSLWRNPKRAPHIEYSKPLIFSLQTVFVRYEDDRFNGALDKINRPDVKVVVVEGTTSSLTAEQQFPHAEIVYLPQSYSLAELISYVAQGKADATVAAANVAYDFMRFNPNKVKSLPGVDPLYIQGDAITFKKGEHSLVTMFDATFDSFLTPSYIQGVFDKYKIPAGMYYKRAVEYQIPQ